MKIFIKYILTFVTTFCMFIVVNAQCGQEWVRIFPKDSTYSAPCDLIIKSIESEAILIGNLEDCRGKLSLTDEKVRKVLAIKDSLSKVNKLIEETTDSLLAKEERTIDTYKSLYESSKLALNVCNDYYKDEAKKANKFRHRNKKYLKVIFIETSLLLLLGILIL